LITGQKFTAIDDFATYSECLKTSFGFCQSHAGANQEPEQRQIAIIAIFGSAGLRDREKNAE
jgi:hypothetical protein